MIEIFFFFSFFFGNVTVGKLTQKINEKEKMNHRVSENIEKKSNSHNVKTRARERERAN